MQKKNNPRDYDTAYTAWGPMDARRVNLILQEAMDQVSGRHTTRMSRTRVNQLAR